MRDPQTAMPGPSGPGCPLPDPPDAVCLKLRPELVSSPNSPKTDMGEGDTREPSVMSSSAVLSRQGDEAGLRLGQLRGVGHSFHRLSAPRGLVEAGTSRLPWAGPHPARESIHRPQPCCQESTVCFQSKTECTWPAPKHTYTPSRWYYCWSYL